MTSTLEALRDHVAAIDGPILVGLGVASGVMLVASLVVTPLILVRLPPDYFRRDKPHLVARIRQEGVGRALALIAKNALALILLAAGFLMLFLPGQGVLTMLIGLILLDFPRKMALERRVIALPKLLDTINWVRRKRGHAPLQLDADE